MAERESRPASRLLAAACLRHRRSAFWVLGFVVVVWAAFVLTAPPVPSGGGNPPTGASTPRCPPSAPNTAAGCLLVSSP